MGEQVDNAISAIKDFVISTDDNLNYQSRIEELQKWILSNYKSDEENLRDLAQRIGISAQSAYEWARKYKIVEIRPKKKAIKKG